MPLPTVDALIAGATAETGLVDFGTGAWRDGLDVMVDSLHREAQLNDLGAAMFEFIIGNALRTRLRVVECIKHAPEIRAVALEQPVIVAGLPRTGTTALAHLLAADSDTRSLRTWEASNPTPPPEAATEHTDPRIAATQAGIDISHEMMPDLPRLYFATATSPSEALDLMAMSFRSFQASGQATMHAYEDWLMSCDMHDAYAFEADVLRLLQHRCPPNRWAWKNPPDIAFIDAVLTAFPDARFVWTHREPLAALTSVCSLLAVVGAPATDSFDATMIGSRQTELWGEAIDRGLASRRTLGDERFVDVFMPDLVADPIVTMGVLYDALGWPFTNRAETAMRAWQDRNRQHGRGDHAPDARDYGLEAGAVAERFADYTEQFGARGGWT